MKREEDEEQRLYAIVIFLSGVYAVNREKGDTLSREHKKLTKLYIYI